MKTKKAAFAIAICALLFSLGLAIFTDISLAQKAKKKRKKKSKSIIKLAPPSNFKPTMTGAPGTVKYYFFPTAIGTKWTFRTIQLLLDFQGKLARADTIFTESQVVESNRFSLQRLPLMVTSDTSYKDTGVGVRSESVYYVDDSVAMTVFNNSITNQDNRFFLVAPLSDRNAWHEKSEDTTITAIAGFVDSVITPIGRFDSVLVTLTQLQYSDLRKYYVPGHGIVKTIFRSPGPSGRGLVIITTEMIAFQLPEDEKKVK